MYTLASQRSTRSIVRVGSATFGDGSFAVIAGPCSVETREQIESTANLVARFGARVLRGGIYKPRTSPYAFQGLGDAGIPLIARASRQSGLPAVVETLEDAHLDALSDSVGMIQIGARNMQNFPLLRAAARLNKPILLKRAAAATLDELLYAAEYILLEGNQNVVLCERGVRGFDPQTRNVFDLAGALRLRELTHLPVIVDPSHATGRASLVGPLVLAAAAAGLDGAMVETHPVPDEALSDGPQSLDFAQFEAMMRHLQAFGFDGRALQAV